MKTIMMIAEDMEENIREAKDHIETAHKLSTDHHDIAEWYKYMAQAHLNFNARGHELVTSEINAYSSSKHYTDHPEYADGMLEVWNYNHAHLMTESAKIKSMIDTFD